MMSATARKLDDVRIGERRQFFTVAVARRMAGKRIGRGRMGVNLDQARRQPVKQAGKTRPGYPPRPAQAEHRIGGQQAGAASASIERSCPRCDERLRRGCPVDAGDNRCRLARNPQRGRAVFDAGPHDLRCHQRMDMKMLVRIHVVEDEAGTPEGRKLGGDLLAKLAPGRGAQGERKGEPDHVAAQPARLVEQGRDFPWRRGRNAFQQGKMQANAQIRQPFGESNRARGRRTRHHQACRRQHAFAMRKFDSLVDLGGMPEVIGGDDETVQYCTSRRSRKKPKNSTPSRNRRLSISGLRAISATIEAIFGARR